MVSHTHYHLKHHHKFERDNHKYVADLETGDIIQVNDVEWEVLSRYQAQTRYQIVEELKQEYKLTAIFDGIERLERLGREGSILRPRRSRDHDHRDGVPPTKVEAVKPTTTNQKPKVLVPFHFTREKSALDYFTGLNRYQLLTHLSEFAELETLAFSQAERQDIQDFDSVQVRNLHGTDKGTLMMPWYAMDNYDGILLLSQFLTDDLLYYRVPDVPVVHCIEGVQQLRHALPKILLTLSAFQRSIDTLVVKASWMKEWLAELGVSTENVRVIPDGIDVVAPMGDKTLAKQHTAAIFEKPMFTKQPIVGLISGFEPNRGAAWISEFARANRHLAIFVYDTMLVGAGSPNPYHLPENVVIFSADDEETRSVLPIFFQALDLVCFPAMPGTPLSIVLEAMAYGAACVVMTKYGMPTEVAEAGVAVKSDWDNFGNFHVPMAELSRTIHQWLQPSKRHGLRERFTDQTVQRHTRKDAARELVKVFEESLQRKTDDGRGGVTSPLRAGSPSPYPPIFCRRYEPDTGTLRSCTYRLGINRYDSLKTALASVLAEKHTPAEVESVFKHFQREGSTPTCEAIRAGNGFPPNRVEINLAGVEHQQKGEKA